VIRYRVKRAFVDSFGELKAGDCPPVERSATWTNLRPMLSLGMVEPIPAEATPTKKAKKVSAEEVAEF
jgi:hypothetical protein